MAPPEPVPKETQEQPGVRCPALPGDGPGRACPGALMKRRHRSRKEWRGRMARLDPLVAGWFFFRKQVAENELTEREEDARKNAPLFSSGEGLCGQEGDDGDAGDGDGDGDRDD